MAGGDRPRIRLPGGDPIAGDSRYASWTELQPIPRAGGYTCDSRIVARGARCDVSDPPGVHVYNPPNRGIAYWVTDAKYVDPQDELAAQFIAWGLKPNTTYLFPRTQLLGKYIPGIRRLLEYGERRDLRLRGEICFPARKGR